MAEEQKFGIGRPARRKEDAAFVTGRGRYTSDIAAARAAAAFVLRSPHAHARFALSDLTAARAAQGVLLVLTAAEIAEELAPLPCTSPVANADGSPVDVPPHHALARDTVRHVGDPIAFIVAETLDEARSAAELIEVDFEPLPVVVEMKAALAPGAPAIWPQIGSNLAFAAEIGSDAAAVEAAFAQADRVVEIEIVNNRVVSNYLETRAVLAEYDVAEERYTLHLGSQGSHNIRAILCDHILRIPQSRMRVVTPDVGGGFGTKLFVYAEYPLAALAARLTGRPVRWVGERSEHFIGDSQGRDNLSRAALALDAQGRFLALRVDTLANLGAYLAQYGTFIPWTGAHMLPGCYRTPLVRAEVRGVYTNTLPVDAYRGAGRPEAAYLIERLVDHAAHELGLPPDELRRRNFVAPEEMPFTTPTGRTYDSGEFEGHMARAMDLADWPGFAARREESAARGRRRGIGIACYIEACAGAGGERAEVTLLPDGRASVVIGTQSNGQGHATAYAQIVSEALGMSLDAIDVHQGDTDRMRTGGGTGGSRSIPVGGAALDRTSRTLAERVRARAADMLEVAPGDLELGGGMVRIAGTDRAMPLAEIVRSADNPAEFRARQSWVPQANTYPNGTHVCELEVDPQTGMVEILAYAVVDDFGAVINPLLLEGQIHGGIVQGIGQALHERSVYDEESGQLLTATLQDYCLPRAEDVPYFRFETRNVPCRTNPLGVKGAGEAGTVGACPAVMNALADALRPVLGAALIQMPATPALVWAALRDPGEGR